MSQVEYGEAKLLIKSILADGEWHRSTRDIHEPLADRVRDSLFGKARKELEIEWRWNGPRGLGHWGRDNYVEWRLPKP